MEKTDILNLVIDLARQAGEILRQEFYLPDGPRGAGDTATVDTEIESFLRERLSHHFPEHSILGEELGFDEANDSEYCWLLDPHDGTAAFLRGFRGSSVSIALLHKNEPILGVVYAPLYPNDHGDLLAGGPGLGLWRNGEPWDAPPTVSALSPYDRIAISQDADDRTDGNLAFLAPARYLALPSIAYRLALAAAGDVRVGLSLVSLSAHDVGAGHALLLAAGKNMVTFAGSGSETVRYRPHLENGRILGGDPAALSELRSRDPHLVWNQRGTRRLSLPPIRRRWRKDQSLSLERAQGSLLGQLAGDSLGSLVEFQSAQRIADAHPQGPDRLRDGGVWDTLAGQPTDDSEMALALARQLISDGGFVPEKVEQAYRDWMHSGPFDIGGTTSQALRGHRNPDSQANGSLMRCSPLGLAFSVQDLETIACVDSAITHPHPLCCDACRVFTQAISRGVEGWSATDAFDEALAHASVAVRDLLERAKKEPPQEFVHQMGWIAIAFQNAFHWLLRDEPLVEAVVWTVRQGGDTDTNAAIVGALVGAFQGSQAIPREWRLTLLTCRPSLGYGSARKPRPNTYWPVDVLNLAELLLEVRVGERPVDKPIAD